MKKIIILLTVLLTVMTATGYAQTGSGRVSGTVIDGSAKVIESATITLRRASDSTVAKMAVANKDGGYSFEGVGAGKYLVSISAVGHETAYSSIFEIAPADANMTLPQIQLVPVAKSIAAVTVVSKKPLIEQKVDRTVVNVEASITNVGSSALEVLEKSPGITVDKDGNISLKGKSGVVIYIDGRPSYLSGADLANLLRSMSATQLEQIEIMTNPPAKYDAAGNSGVINIKTKKNKQFGYNGSLSTGYTQGSYARFNDGANFNYRNGRFNLFTSLNYSKNHRGEQLYINRNFRDASSKEIVTVFDAKSSMINENSFYSAKAGFDYSATKKTTFGVVLSGFDNPSHWQSTTNTDILDASKTLVNKNGAFSNNDEHWKNLSGNFNFRTVLDSAGQELTADVDVIRYRSTSMQPLYSSYFDKTGQLTQAPDTLMGNLPQNIRIYSGKLDYSLPLGKGAKFEAGLKSSFVKTDNNASYDSIQNGETIHDFNRSNHFVYEENVNAAYANYSRPLGKKWNGQLGLRLENTNAKGNQLTTGEHFDRHYSQLFPTAYLQYTANEKNQFVLNYGRRINRPDYENLNPFIHFLDRYTFEQGNPNLKPQFAHNIEISHTYKGFLTTTLNYTSTTDIIQQVIEQNEATNETYIKRANIASQKQVGIAISAYRDITKWWSASVYVNAANDKFAGIVNGEAIAISNTTFLVQSQQQFKWGKTWSAELSGFYRSKGVEGVIVIQPITQFNAGFSKQVMKGKGTVKLNFSDIFAGAVYKGSSRYGTVDARFKDVNDKRAVSVGFNWRFSKGKQGGAGQRKKGGADDEQNRVKVGGN